MAVKPVSGFKFRVSGGPIFPARILETGNLKLEVLIGLRAIYLRGWSPWSPILSPPNRTAWRPSLSKRTSSKRTSLGAFVWSS